MNAIETFVRSRLQITTKHGTRVAGNVPNTRSLEDLIGAVPRCENVDRASGCWGLEESEEKAKTVDLRHAAETTLAECQD